MVDNPSLKKNPGLDSWIKLKKPGRISISNGKVDIGQRISTAVALIAAEELSVDPSRIDVECPDTASSPDEGITSGSNSMEESGNAVRFAAATARQELIRLASAALDAPIEALEVNDGLVIACSTNRSITYWDLISGEDSFGVNVDDSAPLKPRSEYRFVGKQTTARNMDLIVSGSANFIHDVILPNMLHARPVRPPHYHAKLKEIDKKIEAKLLEENVKIIQDGSFLAVLAEEEYQAVQAAQRLFNATTWDRGDGLSEEDIFESLRKKSRESLTVVDGIPHEGPLPPLSAPPENALRTLKANFNRPYQMHGSIGPSAALAIFEDNKLKIWCHSQGIYLLRAALADGLEMNVEDIIITHTPGAGCYGHNGADDAATDAALIAIRVQNRPVLLKWTRDDEHAWEPYGPAMSMMMQASIDSSGTIIDWSQETFSDTHMNRPRPGSNRAGPGRLLPLNYLEDPLPKPRANPNMGKHAGIHRNLDPLYNLPNKRLIKNLVREMPLRTSSLRTLGAYANVFAIESFMDELANEAGMSPLDFRLKHLTDERGIDVLREAADCLYKRDKAPGIGHGMAFAQYKNHKTYAAVGVELEVTDSAEIKFHYAVAAADAGQVVDPDGLSAQLEGGIIQAASWTIYEAVTHDKEGITSRDWDTYPILRFDNVPQIEIKIIDRPKHPFLGSGEATAGPTAAAIANAVFDATGLRLRCIPFTAETIRQMAISE